MNINLESKFNILNPVILIFIYYLLSPIEDVLSVNYGITLKYFILMFIFVFILNYILNDMKIVKCDAIVMIIFILMFISWISTLWSIDINLTIRFNVIYTVLIIFYLLMYFISFTKKEVLFLEKIIIFSGVLIVGYVLINNNIFVNNLVRLKLTEESDPNGLAGRLILPLILSIKYLLISRNTSIKVVNFSIALSIFSICLFTGSRGFVVAICITLLFYFVYCLIINDYKKLLMMIFFILTIICFIVTYLPKDLYERIFIFDSYISSVNAYADRTEIWAYTIKNIIPKMSILGLGSGCASVKLADFYLGVRYGVHNTYLNMCVEYGILFLPVFMLFILIILINCIKQRDIYKLCSLLSILIIAFFLDSYGNKFFWNVLMYSSIGLKNMNISCIKNELKLW